MPAARARGGLRRRPDKALHGVGCIADAATIRERADGSFEVLATGTTRVKVLSVDASGAYLTAEVEELHEEPGDEAGALAEGVLRAFARIRSGSRGPGSGPCRPAPTFRTTRPSSRTWWLRRRSSTCRRSSGSSRPRTRRRGCGTS